jgi:hypothetical protein
MLPVGGTMLLAGRRHARSQFFAGAPYRSRKVFAAAQAMEKTVACAPDIPDSNASFWGSIAASKRVDPCALACASMACACAAAWLPHSKGSLFLLFAITGNAHGEGVGGSASDRAPRRRPTHPLARNALGNSIPRTHIDHVSMLTPKTGARYLVS